MKEYLKLLEENEQLRSELEKFKHIVEIPSWKGKSGYKIYREGDEWIIISWQKPSPDGKPKRRICYCPNSKVVKMRRFLKRHDYRIPCYFISEKLFGLDWRDLWKDRAFYFANYYYCLVILRHLKEIEYGKGWVYYKGVKK